MAKNKKPKTTTISQAIKHLKKTTGSFGWHFHCTYVSPNERKNPVRHAELVHKGHPETLPNGSPVSFTVKLSVNRKTKKVRMETNYDFDPFQEKPAVAAKKAQNEQEKKMAADEDVAQSLMRRMAEDAMEDGKDIDDYDDEEAPDVPQK